MPGVLLAHVGVAVGDVAVDGVGEKENVLGRHADVPAQGMDLPVPDVYPVDADFPAGNVVEPWNQVHEDGFAGAGIAHNGNRFAGLDIEADVF